MNWIKKTLRIGEKIKRLIDKHRPTKEEIEKSDWISCCMGPTLKRELEENLWCCNKCGKHFRLDARQRFDVTFGKGNYEILKTPMPIDDPISWKDKKPYTKRLKEARKKTDQDCGVLVAKGKVNNIELVCAAFSFSYIGGSMGTQESESILFGIQYSIDHSLPFCIFTSSGGARMMESGLSLMQMTRTVIAVNELKNKKLPYIVCLCSPTSGGVTASFAMLGDIHIAEPGAEIIFAGRRVIEVSAALSGSGFEDASVKMLNESLDKEALARENVRAHARHTAAHHHSRPSLSLSSFSHRATASSLRPR